MGTGSIRPLDKVKFQCLLWEVQAVDKVIFFYL